MTAGRCRWHLDSGRCPGRQAFPGVPGVPPFCMACLAKIEPWARSLTRQDTAAAWIDWAARRARDNEDAMRALGMLAPPRSAVERRPVTPNAPERR